MNKVFIGYQGDLAVCVGFSREAIENNLFLRCTSIEEYEGRAELVNGKVLRDEEIDFAKQEAREQQYLAKIQSVLDEVAFAHGYTGADNGVRGACHSVCTYIDTGVVKFDQEGKLFRRWRSAIWNCAFQIFDEVKNKTRSMPTLDEFLELLPKLEDFIESDEI